jgi:putative transposase
MEAIQTLLLYLSSSIDSSTLRQLTIVCTSMLSMTGRVTMLGISRWAGKGGSYRTIQRFFQKTICWEKLNWITAQKQINKMDVVIFAGDATTITKSGKCTSGIGRFFSSIYSKTVKGLSFQCISLINVTTKSSWPLLVEQILPKEKCETNKTKDKAVVKRGKGRPKGSKNKNKAVVELKAEMIQLKGMISKIKALISNVVAPVYFVYDGALGNNAGAQMVIQSGLHLISKLKYNSALFLPWEGEYSGKGAPRKYGSQLNCRSIDDKYLVFESTEDGILTRTFQLQVLSKSFAQMLNITVILKKNISTGKERHIILFSTDLGLAWNSIVEYYSLRFQIEFNFRDAKQFWGLEDFMVIKQVCVTNAANIAFFMVNLSQSLLLSSQTESINDLKTKYHGMRYLDEILKWLPKNSDIIKNNALSEHILALGRIHPLQMAT